MRAWRTVFVCSWFLGLAAGAHGQGIPPQHPIDPDRPDLTNTAHLVDVGFVQFEVGGIYTRESEDRQLSGSPVGIRIGLRDWIEARFGFDNLLLRAVDTDGGQTGIGNLQVGAKIRVWPDSDGQSLFSLLPAVTVPTASEEKGLGSGGADFTVAALTAVELSPRSQVGINYIIGAIAADGGGSHFVQHVASASLGVSVTDHWNPYFEMFAISRNRVDGSPVVAINTGTLYVINPRLALDGGMQFGLTEDASAFSAFGGFSVAVGAAKRRPPQSDRRLARRLLTSTSAFPGRD
jgi:hypothetical protein